jgi:hypothetical protein
MKVLNRNIFVVKAKPPFVNWVNGLPGIVIPVTLEELWDDCTTYLVPASFGEEEARDYIQKFKLYMFAIELDSWQHDPDAWPRKRTAGMFDRWFDLEFHSMLIDLPETPLFGEEL